MAYSYRYYRFQPTALRSSGSRPVQLSEFAVLNAGTRLTGMSITATNSTTSAGEEPDKAGDNSTATKWCSTAWLPTTLVYDFGTATTADGYRWATANDFNDRDPVSWVVAGSDDGSIWVTLDIQTGYATTTSRSTFLSDFTFTVPSGSTTVLQGASTALALSVEVAWGADLTADPGTWTWTDITADVMVDGEQIAYSVGRQDESATSQPASCTLRLDNRAGAYSLGPQAANWPYVRRNTPLRVRVSGDVTAVVFQGYADSWSPEWDQTGRYAVVNVVASGILRRLMQGRQPVLSSIRRAMRAKIGGSLIGYWPMEDNKDAIYCSSDIPGHSPLAPSDIFVDGVPKFADSAPFACSGPIVNMDYSRLSAPIKPYTETGSLQFRVLVEFPKNGMNDQVKPLDFSIKPGTGGLVEGWNLTYGVGGTLRLRAFDASGAVLADSLALTFDVDGLRLRVGVSLVQSGANINWQVSTVAPGAAAALVSSGTFASITLGTVEDVTLFPLADATPVMGHLTVQNAATSIFTDRDELNAYAGEGAIDRLGRLCNENNIFTTVWSSGVPGPAMGPQSIADVVTLLRECETADQGVLYDGDGNGGLVYVAHNQIVNQGGDILFNALFGRLRHIDPIDDDQQLCNRATVSRSSGGTVTDEDTTGPLGTSAVRVYDDSVTVNCASDVQLPDYAGWLVNLGTVEGYRFPQVQMDLRDLSLIQIGQVLGLRGMRRFDISNLSSLRTQLPTGTVQLIVAGWSATVDKHQWLVTHNTGRYAPYRVVELDESDDEHGLRPDTAGSTLASAAALGATSLSVTTSTGPLWTTDSADCPMTIWVGDLPVTVSAISGGSSPQTFTVSALTQARASGVAVSLPRPVPVLNIDDESGA